MKRNLLAVALLVAASSAAAEPDKRPFDWTEEERVAYCGKDRNRLGIGWPLRKALICMGPMSIMGRTQTANGVMTTLQRCEGGYYTYQSCVTAITDGHTILHYESH